jgi:hypothetical protein
MASLLIGSRGRRTLLTEALLPGAPALVAGLIGVLSTPALWALVGTLGGTSLLSYQLYPFVY